MMDHHNLDEALPAEDEAVGLGASAWAGLGAEAPADMKEALDAGHGAKLRALYEQAAVGAAAVPDTAFEDQIVEGWADVPEVAVVAVGGRVDHTD